MQTKLLSILKLTLKKLPQALLLITFSVSSQELSLTKAYELMLKNNGDLAASNFEIIGAKEEQKSAEALYYPSISLGANYIHLNDDIQVDLNDKRTLASGLLGVPDPNLLGDWTFNLQEKDLAFASADLEWPVFAGGKIQAINNAAQTKHQLAKNKYEIKENKLTQDLVTYYYKYKL
ncbi:MAG TPA: TolC family protein, partial [Flavobacteriaceae bacterium]|nr:TolC family protein [Flavobacteriaceae bacterium]